MEVQLERVKTKRAERIEAERVKTRMTGAEGKELRKGERNKARLKAEIEQMWLELDTTYDNNKVLRMENDLKADKIKLMQLYQETQGQVNVRKQQNKVLNERDQVNTQIKGKARNFDN